MTMKRNTQKHNIESAFVLVLFAVFAVTIVAVLALGANSYKSMVERDNNAYNKRIITSYVSAQIRNNDTIDAIAIGGFQSPESEDGVQTLHLYEKIEGMRYDMRIYYYKGMVYEMFASTEAVMKPEDGVPIMDAKGLRFTKDRNMIHIWSKDENGRENRATVGLRCESEVSS